MLGTLISADVVSYFYKAKDTTMRDMPFSESTPKAMIPYINLFYSVSQILATMNMIYQPTLDKVFLVLFPIQIAAFLMTCVRKGVLSADGWHILYAASLGLNYIRPSQFQDIYDWIELVEYMAICALFCVLRFRYRINKYALWIPMILMSNYYPLRVGSSAY